jgi:hypothetical protein
MDSDDVAVITTSVAWAASLVRYNQPELALTLRDEFMGEWGFTDEEWNDTIARLADYAWRKGETPDASVAHMLAVRVRCPDWEEKEQ